MKRVVTLGLLLLTPAACAQDWPAERAALERQAAELEEVTALAGVEWGRCLLEGLARSKAEQKPLLLWALAGDPTGRC